MLVTYVEKIASDARGATSSGARDLWFVGYKVRYTNVDDNNGAWYRFIVSLADAR